MSRFDMYHAGTLRILVTLVPMSRPGLVEFVLVLDTDTDGQDVSCEEDVKISNFVLYSEWYGVSCGEEDVSVSGFGIS